MTSYFAPNYLTCGALVVYSSGHLNDLTHTFELHDDHSERVGVIIGKYRHPIKSTWVWLVLWGGGSLTNGAVKEELGFELKQVQAPTY